MLLCNRQGSAISPQKTISKVHINIYSMKIESVEVSKKNSPEP
uniref:Uncharacterized protein n=1 Tax=Arundo donax TaxID=35708 RepID=A0A0A9FVF9_ARUDO